jgi:hypothetical protein
MNTIQKTFKRTEEGKVILEGVIYETNLNKRITVLNPNNTNKIEYIRIGDMCYYPCGLEKIKGN